MTRAARPPKDAVTFDNGHGVGGDGTRIQRRLGIARVEVQGNGNENEAGEGNVKFFFHYLGFSETGLAILSQQRGGCRVQKKGAPGMGL